MMDAAITNVEAKRTPRRRMERLWGRRPLSGGMSLSVRTGRTEGKHVILCMNPQTAIRTATITKKATGVFLSCSL